MTIEEALREEELLLFPEKDPPSSSSSSRFYREYSFFDRAFNRWRRFFFCGGDSNTVGELALVR
jgi:hypothetical protein